MFCFFVSDSDMGYTDTMSHMDHRRRDGSTVSINSRVTASLTWLSHVTFGDYFLKRSKWACPNPGTSSV